MARTKASNNDGLTDKQRAFAIAFSGQAKGNVRKASELAGIHENSGYSYSKLPSVQGYIKELAVINSEVLSGLQMQETLTEMIISGKDEVYDFNSGKIVEVKMPNRDKIKALELLAKMTGNMLPDTIHHIHTDSKPQEVIDLEKRWDAINRKEVYAPSEEKLKDIFGEDDSE
ncbi:hypothetical protein P2R12_06170 [Cytobacillus oceanisediminis]|uniref:hypothetical protein n=1 Tax=Cytobacillus oceanisediminis TaxID=665099 RepID=UPI0023DC48D2|nr:hypothetical protein [Cytobacillus oceanisediminis]MDF2036579.1 hypothetical protein [Cytobacillus oceanisediminis]